MASSWALALTDSLLIAASRSGKIMGAIAMIVFLLFIIYLMLRSLGFNRQTPFSMVFRKLGVVIRSFYAPLFHAKKLAAADEVHNSGKLIEAADMYLKIFDFDGLTSSRAQIAIHNDSVLEGLEDICEQTAYPFPADRIDRFREDIYDYFLVKTKYLYSQDYDNAPFHRPENEDRFKDELNLTQENQLIEGFQHFLTTLVSKIEKHIKGGAQILPRGTKTSAKRASKFDIAPEEALAIVNDPSGYGHGTSSTSTSTPVTETPAVVDAELPPPPGPFAGADPFGGPPPPAEIAPPPDPFGNSAPAGGDVAPPPGLFGEGGGATADPFSYNDPLTPQQDVAELPPPPPAHFSPNAHTELGDDSTRVSSVPSPPLAAPPSVPQPTGGFPGFGAPNAGIPAPPAPTGFPQPTGAFPGFGQAPPVPQPTGAFAGPAAGAPPAAFPQPTGAFPGLGQAPPAPQPTGAFPGMVGAPPAGFPQPTGAFPGFGQAPAAPPAGFPQATGGFPGFGQAPAAPPAGFPQATGGFPGFQQPQQPVPPNPFLQNDEEKK